LLPAQAANIVNISPNNGPSTGNTTVQITSDSEFYDLVDGLDFTSSQYINTGIAQTGDTKVELDFQLAATTNANVAIFGAYNSAWNASAFALGKLASDDAGGATIQNKFAARYGSGTGSSSPNNNISVYIATQDANRHTWVQDSRTTYWDGGSALLPDSNTGYTAPANAYSMYLGGANWGGAAVANFSGRVYSLKIWKAGVLVRDMKPACNRDRTSCGMIDYVSGQFFGNAAGDTVMTGGSQLPDDVAIATFDGIPATNVSKISTYVIQATTPAHAVGPVDVTATVNGQKIAVVNGYTYRPTIISVSPNLGPTLGGTGFGASYNPSGKITVNGDGFKKTRIGIDQAYVDSHAIQSWTNPAFSSYTNTTDAFGGTITYAQNPVSSTYPAWKIFDKTTSGAVSGNWGITLSSASFPYTATWTLPTGKYVNIESVQTVNGYSYRIRGFELLAGGAAGPNISITGQYDLTNSNRATDEKSAITSIWTNVITFKITSNWTGTYTGLQEVIPYGRAIDLSGAGLSAYPTYFTDDDLDEYVSQVTIDGQNCTNLSVASNTQLQCTPQAHASGTFDTVATMDGITSTVRSPESSHQTDDDYTYQFPPTISAVIPDHGPVNGGYTVEINGSGFNSELPTVTIGGNACTNVTVLNDSQLTCTVPAGTTGAVNVVVANTSGSATKTGGFVYTELFINLASSTGATIDHDNNPATPAIPVVSINGTPSGGINYDHFKLSAVTNNPGGYNLTLTSSSTDLTCSTNPAYKYTSLIADGTLAKGNWGWNWSAGTGVNQPSSWRPIPNPDLEFASLTEASGPSHDGSHANPDNYILYYGANTDWITTPPCIYKQDLLVTAVINP
jgi:hypothetical protein